MSWAQLMAAQRVEAPAAAQSVAGPAAARCSCPDACDAALFSGMSPAAGDTLVDRNNVQYEVLFVEFQTLGNTLAMVARPVVV